MDFELMVDTVIEADGSVRAFVRFVGLTPAAQALITHGPALIIEEKQPDDSWLEIARQGRGGTSNAQDSVELVADGLSPGQGAESGTSAAGAFGKIFAGLDDGSIRIRMEPVAGIGGGNPLDGSTKQVNGQGFGG